jgi:hypothetical protein
MVFFRVFITPNMCIAAVMYTFTRKPSFVSCHQGLNKCIIFIVLPKEPFTKIYSQGEDLRVLI